MRGSDLSLYTVIDCHRLSFLMGLRRNLAVISRSCFPKLMTDPPGPARGRAEEGRDAEEAEALAAHGDLQKVPQSLIQPSM